MPIQDRLANELQERVERIQLDHPAQMPIDQHLGGIHDRGRVKEDLKADLAQVLGVVEKNVGESGQDRQRPNENKQQQDRGNQAQQGQKVHRPPKEAGHDHHYSQSNEEMNRSAQGGPQREDGHGSGKLPDIHLPLVEALAPLQSDGEDIVPTGEPGQDVRNKVANLGMEEAGKDQTQDSGHGDGMQQRPPQAQDRAAIA